jgi:hypothetical protein
MRTSPAASNSAIHASSSFSMRYPSWWQHWRRFQRTYATATELLRKASDCASLLDAGSTRNYEKPSNSMEATSVILKNVRPTAFTQSASQRSAARAWRIALLARS